MLCLELMSNDLPGMYPKDELSQSLYSLSVMIVCFRNRNRCPSLAFLSHVHHWLLDFSPDITHSNLVTLSPGPAPEGGTASPSGDPGCHQWLGERPGWASGIPALPEGSGEGGNEAVPCSTFPDTCPGPGHTAGRIPRPCWGKWTLVMLFCKLTLGVVLYPSTVPRLLVNHLVAQCKLHWLKYFT